MKLIAANLTPFTERGRIDRDALAAHVRWMAAEGVDGFAPTGTTGEFLYLSAEERAEVHAAVVAAADGRPVIACVWDRDPAVSADLARRAEAAGAWAVFLPPPLYLTVPEDVVVDWYRKVRDAVTLPVLAYHHPRVHNPITVSLYRRLVDELGLAGMKDSEGEPERVRRLAEVRPGTVWAGGDLLLGLGARLGSVAGHISRIANLYPSLARRRLDAPTDDDRRLLEQRIAAVDAAGGLPAMKVRLGLGCRFPISGVTDPAASVLPDPGWHWG